jgi:hypothetical protein
MSEARKAKQGKQGSSADDGISRAEHMEHAACRGIIMRMADRGPGRRRPDELPRFLDVVRQTYPAADRRRLDGILRPGDGYDTCASMAFVYANAVPRGHPVLWPVLAFSADRASQRLKIRSALFYEAIGCSGETETFAVGWRLEPPEDVDGTHSYYHAQPISEWDNSGTRKLPVATEVNEVQPAFPIAAADSISMLAAMLVSLYGRIEARNILSDSQIRGAVRLVYKRIEQWL